mgnify:CR=1 FL=1
MAEKAFEKEDYRLVTMIEERLENSVKAKQSRMEEALTVLLAYCGYSIDTAEPDCPNRSGNNYGKQPDLGGSTGRRYGTQATGCARRSAVAVLVLQGERGWFHYGRRGSALDLDWIRGYLC